MAESTRALLLTGGGARAAYQVGVLSAIAELYPRNHGIPFKVLCGTSAGAINATALACYASCFRLGVKKLEWVWKHFQGRQVYRSDLVGVARHLLRLLAGNLLADYGNRIRFSLLDASPLRQLLETLLDFRRIDRNIQHGYLEALAITASDYYHSRSITFFQGHPHHHEWRRAKRCGNRAIIGVQHLLASSAIPFIFPPVRVGQDFFGDGSIHQLSPFSPSIHLGAEQVLAISLGQRPADLPVVPRPFPSSAIIAGHLLDTVFSDTINSDLERLQRINSTLGYLPPTRRSDLVLRPIDTLLIQPSANVDAIARRYYQDLPLAVRILLRMLGIKADSESSIASYLMFEQRYTQELIRLGRKDAKEQESAIRQFLQLE